MYNQEIQKKLKSYFIQRLNLKPSNGKWLSGDCPECNKKLKLGVNIEENRVNCFVCGPSKPLEYLMRIEAIDNRAQAWQFIKAFESTDYLDRLIDSFSKDEDERVINEVTLPEGFTLLSFGTNLVAQCARKFLKRRGFNIKTLTLQGIGFCDKPGTRYFGYLIIPYYMQGKLVYFTSRKILDIGPKFKNPKLEEVSLGKSLAMYNSDALAIYKEIHLVESATNALTLGQRAVGIGGKSISQNQLSSIIRSPVKIVNIFLDPDALKEAYTLGLKLATYKKVRVIELPFEKDVNDIGKKAALELKKQTPIMDYQQLYRKYLSYKRESA
jgi:DNA primase